MDFAKFEKALEDQEVRPIDWSEALSVVSVLSRMHSEETNVSPEQIQLVVAMEELSELSQEISKVIRCRGNRMAVLEELADVSIMLQYIKNALEFSDDDLNKAINVKLARYSLAVPNTEMQ